MSDLSKFKSGDKVKLTRLTYRFEFANEKFKKFIYDNINKSYVVEKVFSDDTVKLFGVGFCISEDFLLNFTEEIE